MTAAATSPSTEKIHNSGPRFFGHAEVTVGRPRPRPRPRGPCHLIAPRKVRDKSGVEWTLDRGHCGPPHVTKVAKYPPSTRGHSISYMFRKFGFPLLHPLNETSFFNCPSCSISDHLRGPTSVRGTSVSDVADFVARPNANLLLCDIRRTIGPGVSDGRAPTTDAQTPPPPPRACAHSSKPTSSSPCLK